MELLARYYLQKWLMPAVPAGGFFGTDYKRRQRLVMKKVGQLEAEL